MDMIVQSRPPNTVRRKAKYLNFALFSGDSELLPALSEEQRAVLTVSGPYKERAEKLGLPIGTVRSRLHRARAALKRLRSTKGPLCDTEDANRH